MLKGMRGCVSIRITWMGYGMTFERDMSPLHDVSKAM